MHLTEEEKISENFEFNKFKKVHSIRKLLNNNKQTNKNDKSCEEKNQRKETTRPFQWQLAPIQNNHKYKKYTLKITHAARAPSTDPSAVKSAARRVPGIINLKHNRKLGMIMETNNYYINRKKHKVTELLLCVYSNKTQTTTIGPPLKEGAFESIFKRKRPPERAGGSEICT